MSPTTAQRPAPSAASINVLVLSIAGMFISIVAAATLMVMAVEDGARVESLLIIMLGALTPTVASLAGLYVSVGTKRQIDFLANGGTDAKVRAAVADVINGNLIRPDAHEQLAVDRAIREHRVAPTTDKTPPPPAQ